MSSIKDLAVLGARPRFSRALACGQNNWPIWDDYKSIFEGIFERQYYTCHGPMAQALEERLAGYLGVRHAIYMSNEYIAMAMLAQALNLQGSIIVPANAELSRVQPLDWAGCRPLFCDVDASTGLLALPDLQVLAKEQQPAGVLALNSWGDACPVEELDAWSERTGIPVFYDSSQAFACKVNGQFLGQFGRAEVMSFQADHIIGGCGGGLITTQDDELAARVRNIRGSYGMGRPVFVTKTGNGRMSEAQAAVALHNFNRLQELIEKNTSLRRDYASGLEGIPGIALRSNAGVDVGNNQNLMISVQEDSFGMSVAEIARILLDDNIKVRCASLAGKNMPACYRYGQSSECFPRAARYMREMLELPSNFEMESCDVAKVVETLSLIQQHASELRLLMKGE